MLAIIPPALLAYLVTAPFPTAINASILPYAQPVNQDINSLPLHQDVPFFS